MLFKSLTIIFLCLGYTQAFFLTHLIGAVANATGLSGLSNLISIDGDARANVLGNTLAVDAAAGIGKNGIGAHAGAGGDVLGQKANLHVNVLDGDKINKGNHKVYSDEQSGRQYILKPVYHGSNYVLERQYLDSADYYGGNNQHAAKPVDRTSENYNGGNNQPAAKPKDRTNERLIVNNENYPIPSDTESNSYITGNNRGRNNNADEESVVIRGDDDTEYWVKGNNGKLIKTHVSDNAAPKTQGKIYYYYH